MDNVRPAVRNSDDKALKELAPEEFQQMLSAWFQEKGLVQDMKSYLKFQMINVLKNTVVGKNIRKNASQTYTLAQQAFHLVIAEYLLFHQCHFALSLFSTEVSLSNILPETKLFFDAENVSREAMKFDKENLVNILELIGISKENQYFVTIFQDYFDTNGATLLSCLVSCIGKDTVKLNNVEECQIDIDPEDDFMKNVALTLQSSNLSPKTRAQLLQNLKICYDLKTKSYENQVIELVNKFKKELHYQEKRLRRNQRGRRCLEKKLLKLREGNKTDVSCSLCHCSEECAETKRLCDSYKKEIENLKTTIQKQKEKIEKLTINSDELLMEFNNCQNKIGLINTRLQEGMVHEFHNGFKEDISLSSESITDEILQQAREKLRLLEEESEELDLRFSKFVVK